MRKANIRIETKIIDGKVYGKYTLARQSTNKRAASEEARKIKESYNRALSRNSTLKINTRIVPHTFNRGKTTVYFIYVHPISWIRSIIEIEQEDYENSD